MNWQEKLDTDFPYGARVTMIEDTVESVGYDESSSFLTPRFVVSEEANHPTVTCLVLEFDKDLTFTIEKLEETSPGIWLVHTPGEDPNFLISVNVDETTRTMLRKTRKEWYG